MVDDDTLRDLPSEVNIDNLASDIREKTEERSVMVRSLGLWACVLNTQIPIKFQFLLLFFFKGMLVATLISSRRKFLSTSKQHRFWKRTK